MPDRQVPMNNQEGAGIFHYSVKKWVRMKWHDTIYDYKSNQDGVKKHIPIPTPAFIFVDHPKTVRVLSAASFSEYHDKYKVSGPRISAK